MGGRSLWGSLLDSCCQRYGWTMQYTIWEVSWLNLQMMLMDAIDTIYPEEGEKTAGDKREGTNGKMGWDAFLSAMHGISNQKQ